jgi:hypothetical protein
VRANCACLTFATLAFSLARAATIRRILIDIPARARRLTLHLPRGWPWARP